MTGNVDSVIHVSIGVADASPRPKQHIAVVGSMLIVNMESCS